MATALNSVLLYELEKLETCTAAVWGLHLSLADWAMCLAHSSTPGSIRVPSYNPNTIVKFTVNTNVVRLITKGDKSAREEVQRLTEWCTEIILILNTEKKNP